jgi:hypothetical protein
VSAGDDELSVPTEQADDPVGSMSCGVDPDPEPQESVTTTAHVLPFHDVPATHDAVPVFVSSVVPLCTDVNVLEAPDPYERVLDTPPLVFAVENCVPFCRVDRVVVKLADTHDTDVVQEEAPLAIVQLGTVSVDVAAGAAVQLALLADDHVPLLHV